MRFLSLILLCAASAASAARDVDAELARLEQAYLARDCRSIFQVADRLVDDAATPDAARGVALMARMICLYDTKHERALSAAEEGFDLHPSRVDFLSAWLGSAAAAGRWNDVIKGLDTGLNRDPATVRAIDPVLVGQLLRELREQDRTAERDRLVMRLADVGFGGDNLQVRDSYLASGARLYLAAGRGGDAERLAQFIVSNASLRTLLTDTRARALWPALEASAGPKMERTNAAAVISARAHADALGPAEASEAAAQARLALMAALWAGGDVDGALAEGAAAKATPDALISEAQAWLLNEHAMLLARRGRFDEAEERVAPLAVLSIIERPWLINMRINREVTRLAAGKHDAVLARMPELRQEGALYGNAYARQLIRWTEICALKAAGRDDEAKAAKPSLLQNAADAPLATVRALMCLKDMDGAAAQLRQALLSEDFRLLAIDSLQPEDGLADPRFPSLRPLLARADVAAAYAEVGRDLPEALRRDQVSPL